MSVSLDAKAAVKFNKYSVGDLVSHIKGNKLIFEVVDVLTSKSEKVGAYLYSCKLIFERKKQAVPTGWATAEEIAKQLEGEDQEQIGRLIKYDEAVLFPMRWPAMTLNELDFFLQEAINSEKFERANIIQDEINNRKNG